MSSGRHKQLHELVGRNLRLVDARRTSGRDGNENGNTVVARQVTFR
jgi:hypothetical protein